MTENKKTITECNTDSGLIKLVAVFFMIIDHMGATIYPQIFELRILGRIAFPLFAWGIAIGADYTKNIFIYALRVFVLGIISQPLYNIVLNHTWHELNIMFTLVLSIIAIAGIQKKWFYSQYWLPILCLFATAYISVDYGYKGVLFVILLYLAKDTKKTLFATFIAYALFWGQGTGIKQLFGIGLPWVNTPLNTIISPFFGIQGLIWLALPLILINTKSGIRIPKYLGYALYPLHLILLIILKNLLI